MYKPNDDQLIGAAAGAAVIGAVTLIGWGVKKCFGNKEKPAKVQKAPSPEEMQKAAEKAMDRAEKE